MLPALRQMGPLHIAKHYFLQDTFLHPLIHAYSSLQGFSTNYKLIIIQQCYPILCDISTSTDIDYVKFLIYKSMMSLQLENKT
jgi:hypothetical protein